MLHVFEREHCRMLEPSLTGIILVEIFVKDVAPFWLIMMKDDDGAWCDGGVVSPKNF